MDAQVARHVIRACLRSTGELQRLLELLKEQCPPDEYQTFAKAIGMALASIHIEIVNRVTSLHPELEGEMETTISRYGRYL
ncbi:MAG: hypothetical protein J0I29_13730 [Rhizobiales bacterium]|nr:hypothetical protein [Hyphomicrobiales bacterium]